MKKECAGFVPKGGAGELVHCLTLSCGRRMSVVTARADLIRRQLLMEVHGVVAGTAVCLVGVLRYAATRSLTIFLRKAEVSLNALS